MQLLSLPVTVVAFAFLLEVAVAEFPERVHPVALFGWIVGRFDRSWKRPKLVGGVLTLVLPLFAAGVVAVVTAVAFNLSPVAGVVVAGLALFGTVSLRMLLETANEVIVLSDEDIDASRSAVMALVGRDAASLSAAEIRSAAVESAAENLSDGLVAPLLAFAIGAQLSVTVGVAAAAYVKAVNTMDSMLGYHSKPLGKASARLDDLVMWLPARVSAGLLVLAARDPGGLWRARSWTKEPASPNSGWPMAALAAVGDVRLSKPGAYTLNPAADLPTVSRAHSCTRIVGVAGVAAFAATGVIVWV